MAFHEAYGLSYDEHVLYPKRIEAVKVADLRRVARRIFDWDLAVTATVLPPEASPEAARRIKGNVKKLRKSKGRLKKPRKTTP